jgi:hypothetical protein
MSMEFNLVGPCSDCPFRSDINPYLKSARVLQIVGDLETATFACHNTTSATKPQPRSNGKFAKRIVEHCGGALVAMAKSEMFGCLQQVAERLGMWDSSKLQITAPVYSLGEMLAVYECEIDERRYWLRELCRKHKLTTRSASETPSPNSVPLSDPLALNSLGIRSPKNYRRQTRITRTLAQLLNSGKSVSKKERRQRPRSKRGGKK